MQYIPDCPIIALTVTATPETKGKIQLELLNPGALTTCATVNCPNIYLQVQELQLERGKYHIAWIPLLSLWKIAIQLMHT